MTAMKFGFGHALTRKEDDKLVRGAAHELIGAALFPTLPVREAAAAKSPD